MRRALVPLLLACFLVSAGPARADGPLENETLFRVSTLPALMQGLYDGVMPVSELLAHGDLGLGTFDGLDGEMVVLDGKAWQVRVDGSVNEIATQAGPDMTTPYAAVTVFEPDLATVLLPARDLAGIEKQLTAMLPGPNLPCAVRVSGLFTTVSTRSVPKQDKPYPPLTEAAKEQRVFTAERVAGTIVGFWLPETWANVGVAGFHLHFLSNDRAFGGHLLDAGGTGLRAELDPTPGLMVVLPETEGFQSLDMTSHDQAAVDAVEKQ